jgi:hypothetical protein
MLRTFKSRVVRRTFLLIKVVPTWKKFEKLCVMSFTGMSSVRSMYLRFLLAKTNDTVSYRQCRYFKICWPAAQYISVVNQRDALFIQLINNSRPLRAHPQEALHMRKLVYCVHVLCQLAAPGLEWNITRTQYTKCRLCSASWGWASNTRNTSRPVILHKLSKVCVTLVLLYWCLYSLIFTKRTWG